VARYFFDTTDGDRDVDREGVDFPDDGAAREAAIRYAGSMLSDRPSLAAPHRPFRVSARDEAGRHVVSVTVTLE
jgi:hypothetical protein